ncbi:MAG: mechanosensitive ion channel family protein [Dissulfurispiraceae bacterium]
MRILQRRVESAHAGIDEAMIRFLKTPSFYWCIATGLYAGVVIADLPGNYAFYLIKMINVIVILSITITIANLSGAMFKSYVHSSNLPIPTTGLANGIVKGSVFAVGILIVLSVLGVSITPLITALGVGGLAVALALQDTLSNLFAGIHILMEKSIRIGDFIRLETGQEGYVEDITWRTTRIRMLPNNMVVIPNGKLAKSIITNYYLPEKRMWLSIPISVSYSSDPEKIERVLMEEVKEAADEIHGLLSDSEPSVSFVPGFGQSSLDFTIGCQIGEVTDQYAVQHALRKRIFRRFNKEGIEIPLPQRTVFLRDARRQT